MKSEKSILPAASACEQRGEQPMTALRASVPERFRPRHPAAADASSATSLHFGAQSNRRPMPFGAYAGAVAAVLKKFVVAFHAARMRQAMREIDRYRNLIADDETIANFATRCRGRAPRPAGRP
ncbi:MAG: hypothetical protein PSV22_11685 [Pseudolabrys sp.]|nr:hypothetical protein [Pseudolabrys sp.]